MSVRAFFLFFTDTHKQQTRRAASLLSHQLANANNTEKKTGMTKLANGETTYPSPQLFLHCGYNNIVIHKQHPQTRC